MPSSGFCGHGIQAVHRHMCRTNIHTHKIIILKIKNTFKKELGYILVLECLPIICIVLGSLHIISRSKKNREFGDISFASGLTLKDKELKTECG